MVNSPIPHPIPEESFCSGLSVVRVELDHFQFCFVSTAARGVLRFDGALKSRTLDDVLKMTMQLDNMYGQSAVTNELKDVA